MVDSACTGSSLPGNAYDLDNSRMDMTGGPNCLRTGGWNILYGVVVAGAEEEAKADGFSLLCMGSITGHSIKSCDKRENWN